MTVHYVNGFTDSPAADCCGATLALLDASEITLNQAAVTCGRAAAVPTRPLRPAPTVDIPVKGGRLLLAPIATSDMALLGCYSDSPFVNLTRKQGTQLRDALNAWLEPTNAGFYTRPDGIEDALWMKPHRELIDGMPGITASDRARLHQMADAVYSQAEFEARGSDADLREIRRLLGTALRAAVLRTPAPAATTPVPQADASAAEQPAAPAPRELLTALQRSIDRARADFDGGAS